MGNLDLIQLARFMNIFGSIEKTLPDEKREDIKMHFSTLVGEIVEAHNRQAEEPKPTYGTWKEAPFNGGVRDRCNLCGHFAERKVPRCDKCHAIMRL